MARAKTCPTCGAVMGCKGRGRGRGRGGGSLPGVDTLKRQQVHGIVTYREEHNWQARWEAMFGVRPSI